MQDNIIYYLKTVSKDTNGKTIFFFAKMNPGRKVDGGSGIF